MKPKPQACRVPYATNAPCALRSRSSAASTRGSFARSSAPTSPYFHLKSRLCSARPRTSATGCTAAAFGGRRGGAGTAQARRWRGGRQACVLPSCMVQGRWLHTQRACSCLAAFAGATHEACRREGPCCMQLCAALGGCAMHGAGHSASVARAARAAQCATAQLPVQVAMPALSSWYLCSNIDCFPS